MTFRHAPWDVVTVTFVPFLSTVMIFAEVDALERRFRLVVVVLTTLVGATVVRYEPCTQPVFPETLTFRHAPLVAVTLTFVPFFSVVMTFAAVEALERTFNDVVVCRAAGVILVNADVGTQAVAEPTLTAVQFPMPSTTVTCVPLASFFTAVDDEEAATRDVTAVLVFIVVVATAAGFFATSLLDAIHPFVEPILTWLQVPDVAVTVTLVDVVTDDR